MKNIITICVMLLLFGLSAATAQVRIHGTVFEPDGEPAIGATVQVQGDRGGTATDLNGRFTIDVPQGKKLVFSYLGMVTQTLTPRDGMRVTLQAD